MPANLTSRALATAWPDIVAAYAAAAQAASALADTLGAAGE
jgi:hypothetical protein